jgi:acetate kinase
MKPGDSKILTINGGSSSIRFALFKATAGFEPVLHGKLDRIGLPGATLTYTESGAVRRAAITLPVPENHSAAAFLTAWLDQRAEFKSVAAVGHRVVQGMAHADPVRITPELMDELDGIRPYDPDHLPREIELIKSFAHQFPDTGRAGSIGRSGRDQRPGDPGASGQRRQHGSGTRWKQHRHQHGFHTRVRVADEFPIR